MLIRNRYLRNNVHAAKLSRVLRKYYYAGSISLAVVACIALASVRYLTYPTPEAVVPARRVLSEAKTQARIYPLPISSPSESYIIIYYPR